MKNLLLTIAFFLTLTMVMAHDNERFMQAMGETLSEMGKAKTSASMQEVANKFERIANTETNEWLPNYYAALINTSTKLTRLLKNWQNKMYLLPTKWKY